MSDSPGGLAPTAVRITNLDFVRGVAVLGILLMNAVSYGGGTAAYFNISATENTWLDWAIGAGGEIFADQKFMGLFSALFGAGIVLFADRAEAKGRRPFWFSMWRNFLLLLIGLVHTWAWDGDVLTLYAICAPFMVAMRNRSVRLQWILGIACVALSPILAAVAQPGVSDDPASLGEYWYPDDPAEMGDMVALFVLGDFFVRGLGMMLIGAALYRTGVLTGERDAAFYKQLRVWGLVIGLPLAALGFGLVAVNDFSPDVAAIGTIPNTIGTIPVVLGYIGVLTLWHRRSGSESATGWMANLDDRLCAAGRMALTNYLSQTLLGLLVLQGRDLSRTHWLGFVLVVWALQLWWSPWWLSRFRYGPIEWLWRCATYRTLQPLRR